VRQPERNPNREWANEHVEAFVDDALSSDEKERFEALLAAGIGEADVELARRIRDGLHALPRPALRPEISRFVLEQARAEVRASRRGWLRQFVEREWASLLRPALTMAVLLVAVVLAVLIGRPPVHPQEAISQADVERALAEARWALAYVSHVSRETGSSVRNEVLEAHVVRPVRHALGAVLDERSETELK